VDRARSHPTTLELRLIQEGYHTLKMSGADEALQTMLCIRPDLLVADVRALKTDAHRFLNAVRNDPVYSRLPVLLLGADMTDSRRLKSALRTGAILALDQSVEDVMTSAHSYLAPLGEPYN